MQEMSLRKERVQIVAPKDELKNLQQLLDMQPPMTTTPSSFGPSNSLDSYTIGMIKKNYVLLYI